MTLYVSITFASAVLVGCPDMCIPRMSEAYKEMAMGGLPIQNWWNPCFMKINPITFKLWVCMSLS